MRKGLNSERPPQGGGARRVLRRGSAPAARRCAQAADAVLPEDADAVFDTVADPAPGHDALQAAVDARRAIERYREDKALRAAIEDVLTGEFG